MADNEKKKPDIGATIQAIIQLHGGDMRTIVREYTDQIGISPDAHCRKEFGIDLDTLLRGETHRFAYVNGRWAAATSKIVEDQLNKIGMPKKGGGGRKNGGGGGSSSFGGRSGAGGSFGGSKSGARNGTYGASFGGASNGGRNSGRGAGGMRGMSRGAGFGMNGGNGFNSRAAFANANSYQPAPPPPKVQQVPLRPPNNGYHSNGFNDRNDGYNNRRQSPPRQRTPSPQYRRRSPPRGNDRYFDDDDRRYDDYPSRPGRSDDYGRGRYDDYDDRRGGPYRDQSPQYPRRGRSPTPPPRRNGRDGRGYDPRDRSPDYDDGYRNGRDYDRYDSNSRRNRSPDRRDNHHRSNNINRPATPPSGNNRNPSPPPPQRAKKERNEESEKVKQFVVENLDRILGDHNYDAMRFDELYTTLCREVRKRFPQHHLEKEKLINGLLKAHKTLQLTGHYMDYSSTVQFSDHLERRDRKAMLERLENGDDEDEQYAKFTKYSQQILALIQGFNKHRFSVDEFFKDDHAYKRLPGKSEKEKIDLMYHAIVSVAKEGYQWHGGLATDAMITNPDFSEFAVERCPMQPMRYGGSLDHRYATNEWTRTPHQMQGILTKYVDTETDFSMRLLEEQDDYDKMMLRIQVTCQAFEREYVDSSRFSWKSGDGAFVYSNEKMEENEEGAMWRRALITEINAAKDYATVILIDSGVCKTLPTAYFIPIPMNIALIDTFCIRCEFPHIPSSKIAPAAEIEGKQTMLKNTLMATANVKIVPENPTLRKPGLKGQPKPVRFICDIRYIASNGEERGASRYMIDEGLAELAYYD